MPPRVAAVLPVVKDFHHASAPRPRAWTETSQFALPSMSGRFTYVRPSPSYRPFPLENVSSTPDRRKDTNMRTIRAEEQDLGFVIQIHKAFFDPRALSGNEEVQNRLPHRDVSQLSVLTAETGCLRQCISRNTVLDSRPVWFSPRLRGET